MLSEKRKINKIIITEQQANDLFNILNDPLFNDVGKSFSIDDLKTMNWKNGSELIRYCESYNLLCLGEGSSRTVFQIDDEHVLKIEKYQTLESQNSREVDMFRSCNNQMKQFFPYIYDWDKKHINPLWIISEQILPASYVDFKKLLGFDFTSDYLEKEKNELNQDLQNYKKYKDETVINPTFNLEGLLDAYTEGNLKKYKNIISKNKWLQELISILDYGLANPYELEIIDNWGLVKRNGQPKIIILDSGI